MSSPLPPAAARLLEQSALVAGHDALASTGVAIARAVAAFFRGEAETARITNNLNLLQAQENELSAQKVDLAADLYDAETAAAAATAALKRGSRIPTPSTNSLIEATRIYDNALEEEANIAVQRVAQLQKALSRLLQRLREISLEKTGLTDELDSIASLKSLTEKDVIENVQKLANHSSKYSECQSALRKANLEIKYLEEYKQLPALPSSPAPCSGCADSARLVEDLKRKEQDIRNENQELRTQLKNIETNLDRQNDVKHKSIENTSSSSDAFLQMNDIAQALADDYEKLLAKFNSVTAEKTCLETEVASMVQKLNHAKTLQLPSITITSVERTSDHIEDRILELQVENTKLCEANENLSKQVEEQAANICKLNDTISEYISAIEILELHSSNSLKQQSCTLCQTEKINGIVSNEIERQSKLSANSIRHPEQKAPASTDFLPLSTFPSNQQLTVSCFPLNILSPNSDSRAEDLSSDMSGIKTSKSEETQHTFEKYRRQLETQNADISNSESVVSINKRVNETASNIEHTSSNITDCQNEMPNKEHHELLKVRREMTLCNVDEKGDMQSVNRIVSNEFTQTERLSQNHPADFSKLKPRRDIQGDLKKAYFVLQILLLSVFLPQSLANFLKMETPEVFGIYVQIASAGALHLNPVEDDLFTCAASQLWLPIKARGVFGGQIIGLALTAATKTVKPEFLVHSLHCYFLLPGDASIPILYTVKRIRDGRAFATRSVVAIQKGKAIFSCMCSFQVAENSILNHQYPMPVVPMPEELESNSEIFRKWMMDPMTPEKAIKNLELRLQEPVPIEFKPVKSPKTVLETINPKKSEPKQMVWMRAVGKLPDNLAFHQCVAAYTSDHYLINTAILPHGITAYTNPRLSMIASLDHSIWFHAPFRADDWLLYEMESTRTGAGRGLCFSRVYRRDGVLVMSCAQEGVVRARERQEQSKL
ncbi:Acyl-CoA thioesterase 8 [Entophlyctis luteolus]|nr:Acyl-CoA thioesterase 8 [Entophlyctis luteolus]